MTRSNIALAAAIGSGLALLASLRPPGDPDMFWHLALGRDTLAGGLVRADQYSWSVSGKSLLTDQWLGQALLALFYQVAGWPGVVTFRALAGGGAVALVVAAALVASPGRPLVGVVASVPAMLLLWQSWTDRPQLLGFLLFAAVALIAQRALRQSDPRALWPCVPLLWLWANAHGSYPLGLAVVALASLALGGGSLRVVAAAVAATLLTPTGFSATAVSGGHFLAPPRGIAEDGVRDLLTPGGGVYAVTLALVFATAFLSRGSWRDGLVLVPALVVSLMATRYGVYLAFAAAPYLTARGPEALAGLRIRISERVPRHVPRAVPLVLTTLALANVLAVPAIAPRAPDLSAYPVAALTRLPAGAGLVNAYEWGGFLIWYAPATPVFVDGRLFPFVGGPIGDLTTIAGARPGWRETIERIDARWLLLRPTDAAIVRARELGWRELASGDAFVLVEVPR